MSERFFNMLYRESGACVYTRFAGQHGYRPTVGVILTSKAGQKTVVRQVLLVMPTPDDDQVIFMPPQEGIHEGEMLLTAAQRLCKKTLGIPSVHVPEDGYLGSALNVFDAVRASQTNRPGNIMYFVQVWASNRFTLDEENIDKSEFVNATWVSPLDVRWTMAGASPFKVQATLEAIQAAGLLV